VCERTPRAARGGRVPAEGSRLRLDVSEEQREELFFLIPKVDTLFVPEELHEFPGRRQPSQSISARGSTAQPHCLHEAVVMVARERDQGGVALHSTTRGYSVGPGRAPGAPKSAPGRAGSRHEQPVAPTVCPPRATRALGHQSDRQRPPVRPHGAW
jgi:hypothetical protein